jgi:hypothetical protein
MQNGKKYILRCIYERFTILVSFFANIIFLKLGKLPKIHLKYPNDIHLFFICFFPLNKESFVVLYVQKRHLFAVWFSFVSHSLMTTKLLSTLHGIILYHVEKHIYVFCSMFVYLTFTAWISKAKSALPEPILISLNRSVNNTCVIVLIFSSYFVFWQFHYTVNISPWIHLSGI